MVAPRNVTIKLHRSVVSATVIGPGAQGATGFDLSTDGSGLPRKTGERRHHWADIVRGTDGALVVSIELVGGIYQFAV